MLELDSCYTSFHKLVMQLFFSNYSDVSQSDWQKEYKPRETHVAQQAIEEQNFLPESTKMLLKRAAKRIQLSDNDKLPQALKVFRSPTYSVGIIPVPTNKKDQIAVVVNPHFYSMRSGGLQTLGVEVPERVRLTGVHPLDTIKQRQRRAEEIHQQLVQ